MFVATRRRVFCQLGEEQSMKGTVYLLPLLAFFVSSLLLKGKQKGQNRKEEWVVSLKRSTKPVIMERKRRESGLRAKVV